MSKSFFLKNVESMNLESGAGIELSTTDVGQGSSKSAQYIASALASSGGAKALLSMNLENSSLDTAMRRSMIAVSGMLARPEAIQYNAESYANQGNEPYRGMAVDFNYGAATQDEFGEAFYRTMVIDPQEGRLNMKIDIPLVYDMYEHTGPMAKNYSDLYKSAIHAYVDDSILSQSVTDLVPNSELADFSDFFVPTTLVGDATVDMADGPRTTRPLKTGTPVSLLAASNATGAANKFDGTDTIAGLEVVALTYKAGNTASGVRLAVANSAALGFIPAVAGVETDYQLQNLPVHLILNADTKLADGTDLKAVAAFNFLGDTIKSVSFSQRIVGSSNFQTGSVEVGSANAKVTIGKVTTIDGDILAPTDASYAAIKTAVESLVLSGWTPKAVATNLNRRKQGRLLDIVTPERNIPIIFGQPMSVIAPTMQGPYGNEQFRSIENLTKVQRIVNSNNAVKQLLNDFAGIQNLHGVELDFNDTSLPGLAQFYIRPWAELAEADILTLVQTTNSADIRKNIEAVLSNILLSQTTRAYKETRLVAAARYFVPESYKPLVIIGADPQLVNFINLQGDPRILGSHFEYTLVTTPNLRMDGLIVWTFGMSKVEDPAAIHPLESGIFAWVPELVGTAVINRGGSTNTEAIVVPRTRHFKNTPVIGMIRVTNLNEALTAAIPFKVNGLVTPAVTPDPVDPVDPVDPPTGP